MCMRYLENNSIHVFDQVKETFDEINSVSSTDNKISIGLLLTNFFQRSFSNYVSTKFKLKQ